MMPDPGRYPKPVAPGGGVPYPVRMISGTRIRRLLAAAVAAAALWALPAPRAPANGTGGADGAPVRMRGLCWEAGRRCSPAALGRARDTGADWISQTPFGWCGGLADPKITLATDRVLWGETDSGLVATGRWARARGMRTLMKPHLWVRGGWVGDLAMRSDADWRTWFAAYERWILHYAELCEREGFEALAVGTELKEASRHTAEWRRIIAAVRRVYHGRLTYCANWHDEAERIEFWDALDFVGVQAYYPLAGEGRADAASVRRAWAPVRRRLQDLAQRTGRPVVFTEVGYKSVAGGLREPWVWRDAGPQDLELQRLAYEELFAAVWNEPWFGGLFIWKWHPQLESGWGRHATDFTPQGKPALAVVERYFRAAEVRGN